MKIQDQVAKKQVDRVAEEVSIYLAIPVKEIFGSSRKKEIVRARRLTYYLSHIVFDLSYSAISRAFKHNSYSAEEKAIKQMDVWINRYPMVRDMVNEIKSSLLPEKERFTLPLLFQKYDAWLKKST